jgi:hypothetical protein
MRKDAVPQDDAGLFGGVHELTYALDDAGRYAAVPSPGWEAANAANQQYWQLLDDQVRATIAAVRAHQASPLAYWMALHQMDDQLLAASVRLWRWRVRRHRRQPAVFARLDPALLARYAAVFRISVADLQSLPADPLLPTQRRDAEARQREEPHADH